MFAWVLPSAEPIRALLDSIPEIHGFVEEAAREQKLEVPKEPLAWFLLVATSGKQGVLELVRKRLSDPKTGLKFQLDRLGKLLHQTETLYRRIAADRPGRLVEVDSMARCTPGTGRTSIRR